MNILAAKDKCPNSTADALEQNRYSVRSASLKYVGTTLHYDDGRTIHAFDFSELYLASTTGASVNARLSDFPFYVDTLLALADLRISRSKTGRPAATSLSKSFYFVRHLLDWLRSRGIYRLQHATEALTEELKAQLAIRSWGQILALESRWEKALDQMEKSKLDATAAFYYRTDNDEAKIAGLDIPFWRKALGWGGKVSLPSNIKVRIENFYGESKFSKVWKARKDKTSKMPKKLVVRNLLNILNDLAALAPTVDRLEHRATRNTFKTAHKMGKAQSSRTPNLAVNDAVKMITVALRLLYEVSPILLNLYAAARAVSTTLPRKERHKWLMQSNTLREDLEKMVGKPISGWNCSGGSPRSATSYSVDEILGAVQGACAVVLGAMNARRQREICDRHLGLRDGDLVTLDEQLGLYQCWFYIEKTYRDRHLFYVNKTTADAVQALANFKKECAPDSFEDATSSSLFECGRYTRDGFTSSKHFCFAVGPQSRSLMSFMKLAYNDTDVRPGIASHMFRRFFAILYYHRYEHAELRALRQHLRHLDVAMTRVYVTDPSARKVAEQISAALRDTTTQSAKQDLKDSLDSEGLDIKSALDEIGGEKLASAVSQILDGQLTAGGFSKIIRKLYRQMLPNITIEKSAEDEVAAEVVNLLNTHKYRVMPLRHGQCHAPEQRRNLKGKCEHEGTLMREHASPRLCGSCPFHFNNSAYMENLQEELDELACDMDDIMLPPQQQARAVFEYENLKKLIILTQIEMKKNVQSIEELRKMQR